MTAQEAILKIRNATTQIATECNDDIVATAALHELFRAPILARPVLRSTLIGTTERVSTCIWLILGSLFGKRGVSSSC